MAGVESQCVPLDERTLLTRQFAQWMPDLVIHTAGMTNVDACEKDREQAMYVNGALAGHVASAAAACGCRLVHISTDHLFSGDTPSVDENEVPAPVNAYGVSKLHGEQSVLEAKSDALVIRTNFYGWGHRHRRSFSDWIITSLRQGREITVFDDVYYTPILIDDLVSTVHQLVDLNASGIFNVVSDERVSKYDFALALAKEFGLDSNLVVRGSLSDVELQAVRPKDMSLSNRKVVELLGRRLGSINDGVHQLRLSENRQIELENALMD